MLDEDCPAHRHAVVGQGVTFLAAPEPGIQHVHMAPPTGAFGIGVEARSRRFSSHRPTHSRSCAARVPVMITALIACNVAPVRAPVFRIPDSTGADDVRCNGGTGPLWFANKKVSSDSLSESSQRPQFTLYYSGREQRLRNARRASPRGFVTSTVSSRTWGVRDPLERRVVARIRA